MDGGSDDAIRPRRRLDSGYAPLHSTLCTSRMRMAVRIRWKLRRRHYSSYSRLDFAHESIVSIENFIGSKNESTATITEVTD
ncbi:hypothetical protein EVAR_53842_1 [Eumeta japonica]|uniref:Uncharacterized protein n=1 Tax=Eumeta variegata TaxID=151549 RepID=A0A4C1ZFA8_EUMVA|nr:hypothetical protein EVAR_53842_1 [Eumeta japonica]